MGELVTDPNLINQLNQMAAARRQAGGQTYGTAAAQSPALAPLPSPEQQRNMYYYGAISNNKDLQDQAIKVANENRAAYAPQTVQTPEGKTLAGNVRTGFVDTGVPSKPMTEQMERSYPGGYSFKRPATYNIAPATGQQYLQEMPVIRPGQQPMMPGAPAGAQQPGQPSMPPSGLQNAAAGGQPAGQQQGGASTYGKTPQFGPQTGYSDTGNTMTPAGAGRAPDPEYQPWSDFTSTKEAEQKGLNISSEELWKSRAQLQASAVTAMQTIPAELQALGMLNDAYHQQHITGGPAAELWETGRALVGEIFGQKAADEVPASQMIDKLNVALAYKTTRELTQRPALIEVLTSLRANPGLKMSDETSMYLINLMQQQKQMDLIIGRQAAMSDNPKDFIRWRDQYYQDHPLISMFTGKPLKTTADYKADIDRTLQNGPSAHGIGGAFPRPAQPVEAQAAPAGASGAAPAAQAAPGAGKIRTYNRSTGAFE